MSTLARSFIFYVDPIERLAYLPRELYQSTGLLMNLLPYGVQLFMLGAPVLWAIKIFGVIVLFLAMFRIFYLPAVIAACIFLTVYQSLVRSFTPIMHAEYIMLYAAYFLTAFSVADFFYFKKPKVKLSVKFNRYSVPLIMTLATLCLSYSFVGIYRVVNGGITIFTDNTLAFWIIDHSKHPRYFAWDLEGFYIRNLWLQTFFKWGFPLNTFVEILAPFCLVSRWCRSVFLFVMIPFHIISWMFLEVFFWHNLVLYILLLDSSRWPGKKGTAII